MGQYILYKGVFFYFFLFFHGKKLLYIYIYVCVNKKKKKMKKVISQCSQTALFRVKWSRTEFLFFFLDGLGRANTRKRGSAGAGTYPQSRDTCVLLRSFWRDDKLHTRGEKTQQARNRSKNSMCAKFAYMREKQYLCSRILKQHTQWRRNKKSNSTSATIESTRRKTRHLSKRALRNWARGVRL